MKASEIIRDVTIRASAEGVEATAAATERLGRAGDAAVVSAEKQSRSALSVDRAYERLQRSIDATYRQAQLFEQGQRTLDRALQQGRITAEAYDRSMGLLSARYGSAGAAVNDNTATLSRFERQTGLASHQVTNLGYQLNDVAVSLASGQSPFTVLFQQGSQILPILSAAPGGIGGALAGIGRYLLGLVTPATVAGAAVAAIGTLAYVGLSRASAETEMLEKALTGLGRSTPATAAGLARIAEAAAAQAKVTAAAAKETAAALASTGQIGISNFESLIGISKQFASALGLEVAEANAKLAASFADPVKGADELNAKLNFLSDATRAYIRELAAQNDQTGAQRALLDALGPALANAASNTTLLGRAWAYVASMASSAAAAIASALKGPSPEQALQAARSRLQDISTGLMARTPTGQVRIKDAQNELIALEEQYRRNGAAAAAASKAMSDEATANRISVQAGDITRALDPLAVKYDEIRQKADTLKRALETPSKLSDVKATQEAYDAYSRALATLTDSQGRLISSTDLLRQKDELAIAAKKATNDADKAAIAERQKALDLVGEVITKEEAARRVAHAGAIERIKDAKAGGSAASDAASAYDNLIQKTKDRIEELDLEAQYASRTATEVIKLKLAHDLERAAKKDGIDVTEEMRKEWDALGGELAAATQNLERVRKAQNDLKKAQDAVADSFKSFVEDVLTGSDGIEGALKSLGKSFLSNSLDALISGKGPLAGLTGLAANDNTKQGGVLGWLSGSNLKPLTDAVAKGAQKGAEAGTVDGVVNGLGSFASSGTGSAAGLFGIDGKQLAGGLTAIAGLAGAYGVGASASSTGMGVLGGALSGAMAGAAVFGPIGALVGAIAGGGLGFLGGESASKKRREELKRQADENYKQAQPQIEALGSQLRGDPQGTLAQRLAEAESSARRLGDVAFFAGRVEEQHKLFADFLTYRARTLAEFSNAYGGMLDALNSGLGPDSPFGRTRDNVKALGDSLKVFIDDTKTVFGDGSAQVGQSRSAAQAYALQVLDGSKTLSVVATRMEEIRGAGVGLQQVLTDLGMSADAAASAIASGTTAALARLKASFETDLVQRTNDAAGASYLTELSDLIAEIGTLRADAAALGTDQGLVTNYFTASAQAIVNGAEITGAAFNDLLQRFPQLIGVVREAGVTIDATARAIEAASRRLQYQDRVFNALNDTTTLAGQLAAFDRAAQREREAELRAGGDAINDLEAALAAERLKIITDFADSAAEEQKRALKEAQNFFDSFSRNLRQFVDGLRSGSDSPLSPEARLAAAQLQYNAQLALAQGGDRDAINSLTTYASSLIDAAKGFYASSAGYQQVFETVTAQLLALPTQVSAEQFIVNAIEGASNATIAAIDTNGDGFISLQEATNANLGAIFSELDINGDGQLSALELIRGAARDTANEIDSQSLILTAANSLHASANSIASTQAALLEQIRSLNSFSKQTLDLLLSQYQTQTGVNVNGLTVQGNIVDSLLKIVYNTGIANRRVFVQGNSGALDYAFASGGYVSGPGTGSSDSISARLSNGEFIMRAAAVDRFGVGMLAQMNDNFALPAMAVPVPVAGRDTDGSDAVVSELRRLHDRIAMLEQRLVDAEYGAAGAVKASVDEVAKETRGARADQRQAANRPQIGRGKAA